ncbi:MAG: TonB family protein [Rhodocyclaceae bacterium]|nr:TonB family protein [Rhodocyclaceae bacterium]
MESSSRRPEQAWELRGFPLRPAVLSLLFHALLLLGLLPQFSAMEQSVPPASVLQGRLLPAPSTVDAPDPVLQRAPTAAFPPLPNPSPARGEGLRLPSPLAGEGPGERGAVFPANAVPDLRGGPANAVPPAPTFDMPVLPEQAQAPIASGAGGEVVPRHMAGPATAALAQEINERGAHAAGLRQFRLALAVEARRFRRYPDAAERAGLAGTAEVRVTVETGVPARRVDLNRSSGHAVLDAAALEMLRQAVTRAALPESLQGRNFVVLLPVVFETEK